MPLRKKFLDGVKNKFLATCCDIVLAPLSLPPFWYLPMDAAIELKSKPAWSGKRWSSADMAAASAYGEMLALLTQR